MHVPKALFLGLALAGVLGGCAEPVRRPPDTSYAEASAAAAAHAVTKDEFVAALGRFAKTTYRYTVEGNVTADQRIDVTGAHDPGAGALSRTIKVTDGATTGTRELILVDKALYLRTSERKRWARVDPDTFDPKSVFFLVNPADPNGLGDFADAVAWVEQTGPGAYDGSFRVAKKDGGVFIPVGAPALSLSGSSGARFTATADTEGNVTSIVVMLRTYTGDLTLTTRFSDFGKPVVVTRPKVAA
ncbi:hypothetical protein [Actinoplanes sp. L3-i22]|uniref:hypothetical protein n=1 Tax=Actinoplanes sp. L3-i22 TaxID=2836373 RepID=UPI001C73FE52|nr:hypothetical protein [Actinoplanes sp. L3-i22]BCY08043.1 hypothetical protein L3i22_031310 [Actinoplanes sp. L3-i22]